MWILIQLKRTSHIISQINMIDKTIFDELNLNDIKRFKEIVNKDNVTCYIERERSDWEAKDESIEIRVTVIVHGTTNTTKFQTDYQTWHSTYQDAIKSFLDWWDKEIVRFNSFDQLTKPRLKL